MVDETPQEAPLGVLDQLRHEKAELDKSIEESKKVLAQLNELKAVEILSGKVSQSLPEPKVEESTMDYYKRVMANKL